MAMLASIAIRRRVTRDVESGVLLEDLRVSPGVEDRHLGKALRRLRDLDVIVELANVDWCDDVQVTEEDRPLRGERGYGLPSSCSSIEASLHWQT